MEAQELQENAEHAESKGLKPVGLTMAIVAVLLALATLLSHRAHTEEIKLQTKVNDGWAFYQAKHERAHLYGKDAEIEMLGQQNDVAMKDLRVSIAEECGSPAEDGCTSPVLKDSPVLKQLLNEKTRDPDRSSSEKPAARKEGAVDIQEHTRELEKETDRISSQADRYDGADLFLEISIVLCSITLLSGTRLYWRLAFVTIAIGIGVMLWGWFLR